MKVGLTYDLRTDYLRAGLNEEETVEFDRIDTIESIEGALQDLGYQTERIGNLASLLTAITAERRWDIVFNIAEGLYGFGREAQVPAVLEACQIPFTFSDSLALALTLHKGMTKHVVRSLGLRTPAFAVVSELAQLPSVDLEYPLFVKPVAEGASKGISAASRVDSPRDLAGAVEQLLIRFRQPVMIERYLPGREFIVGIVGTGDRAAALGVMEMHLSEHADQGADSYLHQDAYEDGLSRRLVDGSAAEECQELALRVWRGLGCRDAGRVDIRMDEEGRPSFLEVNPLAGLNPQRSNMCIMARLAGIDYKQLIGRIMDSAVTRVPATWRRGEGNPMFWQRRP